MTALGHHKRECRPCPRHASYSPKQRTLLRTAATELYDVPCAPPPSGRPHETAWVALTSRISAQGLHGLALVAASPRPGSSSGHRASRGASGVPSCRIRACARNLGIVNATAHIDVVVAVVGLRRGRHMPHYHFVEEWSHGVGNVVECSAPSRPRSIVMETSQPKAGIVRSRLGRPGAVPALSP
jgi:hypothetical protein